MIKKILCCSAFILLLITGDCWAAEKKTEPEFVGTFFGVQVPKENYYFIKGVIAIFGNKFGPQPRTPEEEESAIWDQLLLSFESYRRGVTVPQEEIAVELDKILKSENAAFDPKKDKSEYEEWAKKRLGEPSLAFENQVKHLLQVQRLRQQVMDSIDPPVSDKEAFRAFLMENSSVDCELVSFDEKRDAEEFYRKVRKGPSVWDKEKEKRPKDFKRPGGVTCQFLIDFWKIPEGPLLKMARTKKGSFYPPEPIYKGWAVFKVHGGAYAAESKFKEEKTKKYYYDKIRTGKKWEGMSQWFEGLKKEAQIKIYPKKEEEKKEEKK